MVNTKLIEDVPAEETDRKLGKCATDLHRMCAILVLTEGACLLDKWALRRAVRGIKSEALSLVQANWSLVDSFARELFHRKTMDGPDVRQFLARSTEAMCRKIALLPSGEPMENTLRDGANA